MSFWKKLVGTSQDPPPSKTATAQPTISQTQASASSAYSVHDRVLRMFGSHFERMRAELRHKPTLEILDEVESTFHENALVICAMVEETLSDRKLHTEGIGGGGTRAWLLVSAVPCDRHKSADFFGREYPPGYAGYMNFWLNSLALKWARQMGHDVFAHVLVYADASSQEALSLGFGLFPLDQTRSDSNPKAIMPQESLTQEDKERLFGQNPKTPTPATPPSVPTQPASKPTPNPEPAIAATQPAAATNAKSDLIAAITDFRDKSVPYQEAASRLKAAGTFNLELIKQVLLDESIQIGLRQNAMFIGAASGDAKFDAKFIVFLAQTFVLGKDPNRMINDPKYGSYGMWSDAKELCEQRGLTFGREDDLLRFDGLYKACMGPSPFEPGRILYFYIRCYRDRTVVVGMLSSDAAATSPEIKIGTWFGKRRPDFIGTYRVSGNNIEITTSNERTQTREFWGNQTCILSGHAINSQNLKLTLTYPLNANRKELIPGTFDFEFRPLTLTSE